MMRALVELSSETERFLVPGLPQDMMLPTYAIAVSMGTPGVVVYSAQMRSNLLMC